MLSFGSMLVIVIVVGGGVIASGFIIWLARRSLGKRATSDSLVRSWLAVSLILGLLVFCAASFAIDDHNLRSTLIGGLVASSGAAVAFYFASKNADQARKDILDASFGTVTVPDLTGKTVDEARLISAHTAFELQVDPSNPAPTDEVKEQRPLGGTSPPADGTSPPADGTPPPADGTPPPTGGGRDRGRRGGASPPAGGTSPPADGPPPPADGPPPPADGTSPPADGTSPPADGTSPPADGTPPPADGTPPPADGTPPP